MRKVLLSFLVLTGSLFQADIMASHCSHKHRSTREIVKNIEKLDYEILDTVNNIQATDNEILSTVTDIQGTVTDIQTTDGEILTIVTDIQGTVNDIETIDGEILTTVTDIQSTVDNIQTIDGQILGIVTDIDNKQKSEYVITAANIGTTGYVITSPGSYALADDIYFAPTAPAGAARATFSGGAGTITTAAVAGPVFVSGGVVQGVGVNNMGSSYTTAPTVTITGAGSGATATAYLGAVGYITVLSSSGYTNNPTVTISPPNQSGGAQATAQSYVNYSTGTIDVIVDYPGYGYTTVPTVTISGGGGTASATATVVLTSEVTGVAVNTPGSGYPNTVIPAITIASSDVNLNLNNHILSQSLEGSSSQYPFTVGILVPDNGSSNPYESIYINGDRAIIDGFSMYGIRIFANTYDIELSNLTIINCGTLASTSIRPFLDYVPHTSLDLAVYGSPFGVGGLSIGEAGWLGMGPNFFTETTGTQNRVGSVLIDNVSCLSNYFNGICCVNSTDVTINNSHFDDTYTDDPGAIIAGSSILNTAIQLHIPVASGGNFVSTSPALALQGFPNILNMTVSNTTFNNTLVNGNETTEVVGYGFQSTGFYIGLSQNLHFDNCRFDNTNGTYIDYLKGWAADVGFGSYYLQDVTFMNCSFDNTQGIITAFGVQITGQENFIIGNLGNYEQSPTNIYFYNCSANNTTQNGSLFTSIVPSSRVALGWYTRSCKNLVFENCQANNTTANGPLGDFGIAAGFSIQGGSTTGEPFPSESDGTVLRGCVASYSTTVNGGNAIGFYLDGINNTTDLTYNIRGTLVEDCVAEGNTALTPSGSPLQLQRCGRGFDSLSISLNSYPTSFVNCKALNNTGIYYDPTGNQYSAGFYVTGNSSTELIQKNTFYNCEATSNVYGFVLLNDQYCTVRNCRADFNTDGLGHGGGFVDLGVGGSLASPSVSTSLFEGNTAYANGTANATGVGSTNNYNIYYGSSQSVPVPLLTGSLHLGAGSFSYNFTPATGSGYFVDPSRYVNEDFIP